MFCLFLFSELYIKLNKMKFFLYKELKLIKAFDVD